MLRRLWGLLGRLWGCDVVLMVGWWDLYVCVFLGVDYFVHESCRSIIKKL